MLRAGVIGASGYTGTELLRLLAGHPQIDVALATGDSSAGQPVAVVSPSLAAAYPNTELAAFDPADCDGLDVAFLALPHGASSTLVPDLAKRVRHIVDLAADFRLRDASLYPVWYGDEHSAPELLAEAAFGIPELFRPEITGAALVAAAGCYVTAAALALAPLVGAGAIAAEGVLVDAASGVSGAGKALKASTQFATVHEDMTAYGLLTHRHTPEIEQATGCRGLLFTPHLAPMSRGILATCYARPTASTSTAALLDLLRQTYADEPFVVVTDEPPSTKATRGSNTCHITARYDERTGWVLVLAALDNLVKGAAGQAIQCANLALGLPEGTGLPLAGMAP